MKKRKNTNVLNDYNFATDLKVVKSALEIGSVKSALTKLEKMKSVYTAKSEMITTLSSKLTKYEQWQAAGAPDLNTFEGVKYKGYMSPDGGICFINTNLKQ